MSDTPVKLSEHAGQVGVRGAPHLRLVVPLKGEAKPRTVQAPRPRLPERAELVSLEQVRADMARLFGAPVGTPRIRVDNR